MNDQQLSQIIASLNVLIGEMSKLRKATEDLADAERAKVLGNKHLPPRRL